MAYSAGILRCPPHSLALSIDAINEPPSRRRFLAVPSSAVRAPSRMTRWRGTRAVPRSRSACSSSPLACWPSPRERARPTGKLCSGGTRAVAQQIQGCRISLPRGGSGRRRAAAARRAATARSSPSTTHRNHLRPSSQVHQILGGTRPRAFVWLTSPSLASSTSVIGRRPRCRDRYFQRSVVETARLRCARHPHADDAS